MPQSSAMPWADIWSYYLLVRADNAGPPWDASWAAELPPQLPPGATSVSEMGTEPA